MDKPLLVGELNPYGGHPQFALVPYPDGCSGHRLCRAILGMTEDEYMERFDRTNLCAGEWDLAAARMTVGRIRADRVILLGSRVCQAHWLEYRPFEVAAITHTRAALILPHPSGRCRTWNDPACIERARRCVRSFAPELYDLIGRQ